MLLKGPAIQRTLARPDPATRLFVLAGPDEAGSRALAKLVADSLGPNAERIDIAPSKLKDDPALLADEAAAISLFGDPRWICVSVLQGSGDEAMAAAEALLAAPAAGNPVVIIGGGMTAKSRLTKLAEASGSAVAVVSYPPEGGSATKVAEEIAAALGLTLERGVGRAVVDASGGDRAVMAQELTKLALYRDVDVDRPGRATMDDWQAIGANLIEEDVGDAVNIVLDGRVAELPALFHTLDATGTSEIRLVRAIGTRAMLLAKLRPSVEQGQAPGRVVESEGRGTFWKEVPAVTRQLGKWNASRIARLVDRLHALERALKAPDNAGILLLRAELLEIARVAAGNR